MNSSSECYGFFFARSAKEINKSDAIFVKEKYHAEIFSEVKGDYLLNRFSDFYRDGCISSYELPALQTRLEAILATSADILLLGFATLMLRRLPNAIEKELSVFGIGS